MYGVGPMVTRLRAGRGVPRRCRFIAALLTLAVGSLVAAGCSVQIAGDATIAGGGPVQPTAARSALPHSTSSSAPHPGGLSRPTDPSRSTGLSPSTLTSPVPTPTASSSVPSLEPGRGSSPAAPRPGVSSGGAGSATSPTPTPLTPAELRRQHDAVFGGLLTTLSSALVAGDESRFLSAFAAPLKTRVGHWFANTRNLGVDGALFARSDDYSSDATDAASSFTRTVVLGIRTPYDDPGSMPGVSYAVTVSLTTGKKPIASVTIWQPKYLGDPMNCDCTMRVASGGSTAVVADASDGDLMFWLPAALQASSGIAWSHTQMQGSGLVAPAGQVIFLAHNPFHWFLSASGPAQASNVTAGLVDALGKYPGTRYSNQSRIVLLLQASDGSTVPNDPQGREYASDVITHESTHQLMNENSTLPERAADSPPTWVVEGIAVAVETLYRDSLGEAADVGYPEPNDPKNVDKNWFAKHLGSAMPTAGQLYAADSTDGAGYYAISGSVFRYLDHQYGYVTMMKVAKAMYSKPAQTPFSYFPDPDHPGATLAANTAENQWRSWFVEHYE